VKLAVGIVLLLPTLAVAVLAVLAAGWSQTMFTVGLNASKDALVLVAGIAVFVAASAYLGARLIFAWLREEAGRQAAKIEQL